MAFTKHGHHIPGTVMPAVQDRPKSVARCGGVNWCKQCIAEVEKFKEENPPKELTEENVAHAGAVQAEHFAESTPATSMHFEEQVPPDIDPSVDLDKWEPQTPSDQTVDWDIDKNQPAESFPAEVTPAPDDVEDEFRATINRHSLENESGTPDFILAYFLDRVLRLFSDTVHQRSAWRGESVELPALQQLHRDTETMDKTIKHLRELVEQGVITINEPLEATDIYRGIMDAQEPAHPDSIEVPLVMYVRGQRNEIGTARITVGPGEALVDKPINGAIAMFEEVPDAAYVSDTPLNEPKDDPIKQEVKETGAFTSFDRYIQQGLTKND